MKWITLLMRCKNNKKNKYENKKYKNVVYAGRLAPTELLLRG